jgi:hypothetical protein
MQHSGAEPLCADEESHGAELAAMLRDENGGNRSLFADNSHFNRHSLVMARPVLIRINQQLDVFHG